MNLRLVSALMRLYPAWWRQRYAAEFSAFLRERKGSALDVLNIIGSAMRERMFHKGKGDINKSEQSSGRFVLAFIAMLAGGINLVMTVDDSPLIDTMRASTGMSLAWNLLAATALLSAAGMLPTIFRLYRLMLLYATREQRRDILFLLSIPFFSAGVLSLWGVCGWLYTGGSWIASPWSILESDGAPSSWPSLQGRWICGIISVVLSVAAGLATAVSIKVAIRRTDFGSANTVRQNRLRSLASLSKPLITACSLVMFLSVLAWGLAAQQSAPTLFQRSMGLLNATAATSWGISLGLFGFASVICLGANRIEFAPTKRLPGSKD